MNELRPYQEWALNELRSGIKNKTPAQVLMMATGAGKTTVASQMMLGAMRKGKRAYFVVDSLELVDQAVARFVDDGLEVGVIQGDNAMTDYGKPIQVATIQTLRSRWQSIVQQLKPDVLVVDECHVAHTAHKEIIEECKWRKVPVIGLSATPFRKGLGLIYDDVVVGATTKTLTDQGYLCPAKCYAPYIPNLDKVKTKSDGDYVDEALGEYMGDAQVVGDVVGHWMQYASGRRTLVFAPTVATSRKLCDEFQRIGVAAEHVDGYDPDKVERKHKIDRFRSGQTQVLCNVAVLTKGFDAPEASCIMLARPTKSLMLHIQMIGRGLRTAPGKQDCLILDCSGNTLRNGLPTDEMDYTLHDGKSKENPDRKKRDKKDPVESACGNCGFVSMFARCPQCGHVAEPREDLEVVNGELYEVETGAKKKWTVADRERLYSEFLGYANQKGFSPGYAYHKVREYTGTALLKTRNLAPKTPSEETLRIIKHLQIKHAKRRQANAN